MLRPLLLGLAAAALPALAAAAAPATPEEAARLTALFERYLGAPAPGQPASVAVAPRGEGYDAVLDVGRALGPLAAYGVTLDPVTTAATLTPLADGTWRVQSADSPTYVIHVGQGTTFTLKAATGRFEGVYDPAIRAFRTSHQEQTGYDFAQSAATGAQDRRVDKAAVDTVGTPAGAGVDVASHYAFSGMAGSATPPPGAGAAGPAAGGTAYSYRVPTGGTEVGIDRLRTGPALDLWSFLVAHPDRGSLVAAQGELKALLRAGIPYADALRETASLDAPSLDAPFGTVKARALRAGVDASNLVGAGRAALSLAVDGLDVPSGPLPPWSAGLVPTALDLHVALDGFHAAEAAALLVDGADLGRDVVLTDEQRAAARRAFWPGGTVEVARSHLATAALDLDVEGRATLAERASGRFTVTGRGLDAEIAALQARAAADPGAGQAMGPLVLARNLAKPGPDGALVWVVEFGGAGVTVNGSPLQ